MSMENPEKGIESLAASVIQDNHESCRAFCPCCKDDSTILWNILTGYTPTADHLSAQCSGNDHGHCECCCKFKWTVDRAFEYANATGLNWQDILSTWEQHRNYWYMNYYQPANQPDLSDEKVFVFDDLDAFRNCVGNQGFICPSCGKVSKSPYECSNADCDWKSYGFFKCMGKGAYIFVKSEMRGETIFMPVALAGDAK